MHALYSSAATYSHVHACRLTTMGPKLLVSKLSTADQPALRWHVRVMGNTALEFGVVPVGMEVRSDVWLGC